MKCAKNLALALLLAALLIVSSGCKTDEEISRYQAQNAKPVQEIVIKQEKERDLRTMTITGAGKVEVDPDLATVQLSVQANADTSEEAARQNNELMKAVLLAVKGKGVSDANIMTQTLAVLPIQDAAKAPPEIKGYTATNTVKIQIRNVARTSEIIDAAGQAGATVVFPIEFHLLDDTKAAKYQEALLEAVADAMKKAENVAAQADIKLDGPSLIVELYDEEQSASNALLYEGYTPAANKKDAEDISHTPLQAGQLEVIAKVEIDFRIAW